VMQIIECEIDQTGPLRELQEELDASSAKSGSCCPRLASAQSPQLASNQLLHVEMICSHRDSKRQHSLDLLNPNAETPTSQNNLLLDSEGSAKRF
jgi:hypothetical protein